MQAACLPDRAVIRVAGPQARQFLNGLVTVDVDTLAPERPRFAALLTPQGKIVADFFLVQAPDDEDAVLLDCPRALSAGLAQKLNFYKLRAKVTVEDQSAMHDVWAVWDGAPSQTDGFAFADPRLPALGFRGLAPAGQDAMLPPGAAAASADSYERHRILLAVPRGGVDFSYGDAFPHEADMDQLGGIDFDKGCYVGQEVVSRMHHRGTARTRILPVRFDGFPPEAGLAVMAGGKQAGVMGSGIEGVGLATLRLDRVEEARAAGVPLVAGGIELRASKPAWARFAFPGDAPVPA